MVSFKDVIRFIYCNLFAFSCDSLLITAFFFFFFNHPLVFRHQLCSPWNCCCMTLHKHCSNTACRSCLGNCVPYIYVCVCMHAHAIFFSDLKSRERPSVCKGHPVLFCSRSQVCSELPLLVLHTDSCGSLPGH